MWVTLVAGTLGPSLESRSRSDSSVMLSRGTSCPARPGEPGNIRLQWRGL